MKIVVAPDSFKECLSAKEVCHHIARGLKRRLPRANILQIPMADGGEGTLDVFLHGGGGRAQTALVPGPLGKPVRARWGLFKNGRAAVIEMAQASGLALVAPRHRNPLKTSSYGTGLLIRKALDAGCGEIYLTLGGVATNDGGAGMARALGYQFLDNQGRAVDEGAGGLGALARIDSSRVHPRLKKTRFIAACDVTNPLCGPRGSAAVFGPQKGATKEMVLKIDRNLRHFATLIKRDLKKNVLLIPGGAAAGGAGAGAAAFLNAELKPGAVMAAEAVDLEKQMCGADLVITGEGSMDAQTAFGKTPAGVAKIAKQLGIPVLAVCGQARPGAERLYALGVGAIRPLAMGGITPKESMARAGELLERAAEDFALFLLRWTHAR